MINHGDTECTEKAHGRVDGRGVERIVVQRCFNHIQLLLSAAVIGTEYFRTDSRGRIEPVETVGLTRNNSAFLLRALRTSVVTLLLPYHEKRRHC